MNLRRLQRRSLLAGFAAAPLAVSGLSAATTPSQCKIDDETSARLTDWPNLARYAAENERVLASGKRSNIVFMGDSITQGWPDKRPEYFSQGRICRGISGQTSGQMVLRMMADIISLKPKIVHIMAGTNDIAGNTGPMTPQQTLDNIEAMTLLGRAKGITVLVGSIPPAANFPWRPNLETVQAIAFLNSALARLAQKHAVFFVDYTPALSDGAGGMKKGFSYDGVHPDTAGYQAMERVLEPIIFAACRKRCAKTVNGGA